MTEVFFPHGLLEQHSPPFVGECLRVCPEVGADQGAPFRYLSGVVVLHAPGELVRLYKFFSLDTHFPKMFCSSPVACIL